MNPQAIDPKVAAYDLLRMAGLLGDRAILRTCFESASRLNVGQDPRFTWGPYITMTNWYVAIWRSFPEKAAVSLPGLICDSLSQ